MLGIAAKGLGSGHERGPHEPAELWRHGSPGAPLLYHSGRSQDVAAVAQKLIDQDQISRLALAGFSMGGNLVLKLAGEWGSDGPEQFKAVAAVCPAVDLAASADALHVRANRVYEEYFLWKLNRRLRTKARLFPDLFDTSRLRGIATFAISTTRSQLTIAVSLALRLLRPRRRRARHRSHRCTDFRLTRCQ